MSYYPALKKAETFRLALVSLSILLPLIGAVLAVAVINDIWFIIVGFVAGCFCTYVCVKLINKYIKVYCPICSSDNISENYANSPRGTNSGVEHNCSSCNSKFIDGQLVV
jgi:hypothetical protein